MVNIEAWATQNISSKSISFQIRSPIVRQSLKLDKRKTGTHATKTTPKPNPMHAIQATKKSSPVGQRRETIWFPPSVEPSADDDVSFEEPWVWEDCGESIEVEGVGAG
jgi:hypothetical protein